MKHMEDLCLTRLAAWRRSNGLTLDDVAGLTGLSPSVISRAERKLLALKPLTKVRVARALGVSVATLFEPEMTEAALVDAGVAV